MKLWHIITLAVGIAIFLFLAWFFSTIVVYFLVAIVLSIIGAPIVRLIERIRYKNFRIPRTLSSLVAIAVIIAVFSALFMVFVPLISAQAAIFAQIDVTVLSQNLRKSLIPIEQILHNFGLMADSETLETLFLENIRQLVDFQNASAIFTNILTFAGSLFIGIFAILFITFFLLRGEQTISNVIMLMVPQKYNTEAINIISNTRRLLTRYFVGTFISITIMIILISLGLSIFGLRNAVLIGLLGGFMNIIPYLGNVIGVAIGLILGLAEVLSAGEFERILPVTLAVIGVFVTANLIENLIIHPLVYSSSVKAHPLEIFVVLLMGGIIGGVAGMILAIPTYTVLRVIAKEFIKHSQLVKKLTENI